MKKVTLCLFAVFLTAMGPRRPILPDGGDDEVMSLYSDFKVLANDFGTTLQKESITFSFTEFFWGSSTVGLCRFYSRGPNQIELSRSNWNRGTETFKEMLLFHELGHCALGRGHFNATHSGGRPESLMNSWLFSQNFYRQHRDEYLKELFTSLSGAQRLSFGRERNYDGCTFGEDHSH